MEAARTATADDVDAMVGLARAAIGELSLLRGGGLWQLHAARQEPLEASLAADVQLGPPGGCAVVGTVDEAVVGYGVSRVSPLADGSLLSVITDLYVDPAARGIGVGEAMMDQLVAHAESIGAIGVDSMALPGDRATKNFFETFGLKARAIVVHRSLVASDPPDSDDRDGGSDG